MSLATRCSACATVFRVAQDQLKVSEGWVRCGRCDAVFNALEGLFDLGREQPGDIDTPIRTPSPAPAVAAGATAASPAPSQATSAEPSSALPSSPHADAPRGGASTAAASHSATPHMFAPPVSAMPAPAAPGSRPSAPAAAPELSIASSGHDDGNDDKDDYPPPLAGHAGSVYGIPQSPTDGLLADPIDAHLFRKRGADPDKSPAVEVDARDRLEFSDARFDSDLFAENPSSLETTLVEVGTTDAGDLPLESASQQPDFLRRADRRGYWRSGPRRLALAIISIAAAVLLGMQVAGHFRDIVAAQWPALRPLLVAGCRVAGCSVEAPRRIDEVSVESSSLSRAIGQDAFVLSVTLRSRSRIALRTPSIDLTLTDGNGRLVARRALSPKDFGVAGVLPAGAESALQFMLATGNYRVAGYTVEIFYP
ncbi:MAG TPA: zinc-ribbon and DUF3426 domain-containing protein [Caldimonas sp.]|nr:zinc-ribbon and DUF3426 domain-containing protein [Caldimonas sp.]